MSTTKFLEGRCEALRANLSDAAYVLLYTAVGMFSGRPVLRNCLSEQSPYLSLTDAKLMTWNNLDSTNDVGDVTLFVSDIIAFTSGPEVKK